MKNRTKCGSLDEFSTATGAGPPQACSYVSFSAQRCIWHLGLQARFHLWICLAPCMPPEEPTDYAFGGLRSWRAGSHAELKQANYARTYSFMNPQLHHGYFYSWSDCSGVVWTWFGISILQAAFLIFCS